MPYAKGLETDPSAIGPSEGGGLRRKNLIYQILGEKESRPPRIGYNRSMEKLPTPAKEAIFYENERLYICLASFPITNGHSIVVWKNKAEDLHLLSRDEYEYLMDMVDTARNTLLETLKIEKVYLFYMDEVKQVHWHLVPRYDERGFNMLVHEPKESNDFSLVPRLNKKFIDSRRKF